MLFPTFRLAWKLAFGFSVMLITVGSLLPAQQLPDLAFDIWDKAQHAAGFGWLMFCGLMAHPWRDGGKRLAVGLGLWGALIEVLQALSGWRHGDLADLAADLLGIATVLLIWRSTRPAAGQPET